MIRPSRSVNTIVVETVLILAMICMSVLLYLASRPPDS